MVRPGAHQARSAFHVLITSRSRLTGLDTSKRIRLDALSPADAVRLLDRLAGHDADDSTAARRIAELCGGLPLALRIVGTKLRTLPHLTIHGLAQRLEDERHRLDELVGGDREVRAGFLLSYAGLDAAGQRAFRLLSLVPGTSFPAWAAAAVLGEDLRTAERRLDRLVEANLLECGWNPTGRVRYHFHDLLRLFASEKAEEDIERDTARRRVVDAYLHIARRADARLEFGGLPQFDDPPLDLGSPGLVEELVADAPGWLDEEYRCVLDAVEWAARSGFDELTCHLAASLGAYLEPRAHWDHMVHVMELSLTGARRTRNPYLVAFALFAWGLAAREKHEHELSQRLLRECLELLPSVADARLAVVALLSVGVGHRLQGRWSEAAACFADSLSRLSTLDDPCWSAYTMRELDVLHRYQGEWDDAARCLRQAIDGFGRLGNRRWQAASTRDLGIVHREQGDFGTASELLTTSREAFHELGDRRREAGAWRSLAYVHLAVGDLDQAHGCAVRSRELFAHTLDRHGAACTDVCVGEVLAALGDDFRARIAIQRGPAVLESLGDRRWTARALRALSVEATTSP